MKYEYVRTNVVPAVFLTEESRWNAVLRSDKKADGHFVYGVTTTKIYCNPSSGARKPKRENVVFFDSPEHAAAAGYRASRRFKGNQSLSKRQRALVIAKACRLIEKKERPFDLSALAAAVAMSPSHLHRVFKAETGLTPKVYYSACRTRRLREQLAASKNITEAIYEAGFNSNSRLYENYRSLIGMRPKDFRNGGRGAQVRFALGECSLGAILVAMSQRGICSIALGDDAEALLHEFQDQFPEADLVGADPQFERMVAQVVGLVESPSLGLNLPLDIRGTAFQQRVWQALREIPPGTTVTYSEIAERIQAPTAVRAVARACAANKIAIAIPCHRVVRRNADPSGYRWGVERKLELLKREAEFSAGAAGSAFASPRKYRPMK